MENKFTIRVYGLLINEDNEVLITEEVYANKFMRKFPGGGLEQGEGIVNCLERELKEELGIVAEGAKLFYMNPDYVVSAFDPSIQLISVYYKLNIMRSAIDLNFADIEGRVQKKYWESLKTIEHSEFTFPIDQKVAKMLAGI